MCECVIVSVCERETQCVCVSVSVADVGTCINLIALAMQVSLPRLETSVFRMSDCQIRTSHVVYLVTTL